jgi:uncharacterized membrane protein YphA (DoxX/SURF4 family)
MVLILRLLIGTIFTVSGFEKAIGPSGNFLYVIQQYQVMPMPLAKIAAAVFPWAELLIGVFLVLGLWLPVTLRLSALTSATLMLLVGQAIVRRLPMDNCGCFGDLVHLPLAGVIFLDLVMLVVALVCLRYLNRASSLSLDALYSEKK